MTGERPSIDQRRGGGWLGLSTGLEGALKLPISGVEIEVQSALPVHVVVMATLMDGILSAKTPWACWWKKEMDTWVPYPGGSLCTRLPIDRVRI